MHRIQRAATGVVVAIVACGGVASCGTSGTKPATVTVTSTSTLTVAAPAPAAPPAAPAGPKTTFGDGIFAVGTDVAAGTYSTPGPRDFSCAYTFLPRKGAQLSEADGGNSLFGPGYMEVSEGQIVQTIGCTWTLEPG